MRSPIALTLTIIFCGLAAATLRERYEAKASSLNPLLLPILDIGRLDSEGRGPTEIIEALINRILMNSVHERTHLWIDLVKGTSKYEFYFDRSWDKENKEDLAVKRKAQKTFLQYLSLGAEEKCKRITAADIKEFEQRFKAKIVTFVATLVEHRQKSLLYQVLPNGSFEKRRDAPLVFKNDVEEMIGLLYGEVEPFVKCLEAHRTGTHQPHQEGFFARLWNWIRSIFGFKPKKVIVEDGNDLVNSGVREKMDGVTEEASLTTHSDKIAEIKAFIDTAAKQGAKNLEDYKANLELLIALMRSPAEQLVIAMEALLLMFKADGKFYAEGFEYAAFPIYEYSISLNCESSKDHECELKMLPGFDQAYDQMAQLFVDAFSDRSEVIFSDVKKLEAFVFKGFGSYLKHLVSMDQHLAMRSLQKFWRTLTKHTRSADQIDNPAVASALEELMPMSPAEMSNGRMYGLAHEIASYRPEGQGVTNFGWLYLFVEFFADFSVAFGLNPLRIGGASKIMVLNPMGPDSAIPQYYDDLNSLVVSYFETETEASETLAAFPARFDKFLDAKYHEGDPLAVRSYPLLKIHNLWAANKEASLPSIKFTGLKKEHLAAWFEKLYAKSGQEEFKKFVAKIAEKRGAGDKVAGWNKEANIWEEIGEITWADAQSVNVKLSELLNEGAHVVNQAEQIVQLI